MHMTFYGATNTVTGSRTLVEVAGKRQAEAIKLMDRAGWR